MEPPTSEQFESALVRTLPDQVGDQPRQDSIVTNQDRIFLHYHWATPSTEPVASLRLQLRPREQIVWIAHIEVSPSFRNNGIGTTLVRAVERAATTLGSPTIRLFPRHGATSFWRRLGFRPDPNSRNMLKRLSPQSSQKQIHP